MWPFQSLFLVSLSQAISPQVFGVDKMQSSKYTFINGDNKIQCWKSTNPSEGATALCDTRGSFFYFHPLPITPFIYIHAEKKLQIHASYLSSSTNVTIQCNRSSTDTQTKFCSLHEADNNQTYT